jgi:hypothetical protein
LINALAVAGFTYVYTTCDNLEISAIALKQEPNAYLTELLELDDLQTN